MSSLLLSSAFMPTAKQTTVYTIATVIMAVGLLRVQVHSRYDDSSPFEMCCFIIASTLLAFPLLWLWRARRDTLRLLPLLWVVGLQECVCIAEFLRLVVRALKI